MNPKKLILSRKGFDSSAGGCPSPIFPDGNMLALPIPDENSVISYNDLLFQQQDLSIGELVEQLTKGKMSGKSGAHLDPDMIKGLKPRKRNWIPNLGQTGAAQSHLEKHGVGIGDVFLFFGLFQPVIMEKGVWKFDRTKPKRHVIWGWMEIGKVIKVDQVNVPAWLEDHPHLQRGEDSRNTIYLANSSNSGYFKNYHKKLCLSDLESTRTTDWIVPNWMFPGNSKVPMSYHENLDRWQKRNGKTHLKAVARGQEFVIDLDQYSGWKSWFKSLTKIR